MSYIVHCTSMYIGYQPCIFSLMSKRFFFIVFTIQPTHKWRKAKVFLKIYLRVFEKFFFVSYVVCVCSMVWLLFFSYKIHFHNFKTLTQCPRVHILIVFECTIYNIFTRIFRTRCLGVYNCVLNYKYSHCG